VLRSVLKMEVISSVFRSRFKIYLISSTSSDCIISPFNCRIDSITKLITDVIRALRYVNNNTDWSV